MTIPDSIVWLAGFLVVVLPFLIIFGAGK